MTESPTPNTPQTADDVKLLRAGDLLLTARGRVGTFLAAQHSKIVVDCKTRVWGGSTITSVYDPDHWRFLGRPDQSGWIPHDGRENPAPGLRVDVKLRSGAVFTANSDDTAMIDWSHMVATNQCDITHWRPHVPAAGERLQSREMMLADLEAPKGEVKAAVEHIADRLAKYAGYVTVNVEQEHVTTLLSALSASQAREARAVEALEFYAEPVWSVDGSLPKPSPHSEFRPDCGDTARHALATLKEQPDEHP